MKFLTYYTSCIEKRSILGIEAIPQYTALSFAYNFDNIIVAGIKLRFNRRSVPFLSLYKTNVCQRFIWTKRRKSFIRSFAEKRKERGKGDKKERYLGEKKELIGRKLGDLCDEH